MSDIVNRMNLPLWVLPAIERNAFGEVCSTVFDNSRRCAGSIEEPAQGLRYQFPVPARSELKADALTVFQLNRLLLALKDIERDPQHHQSFPRADGDRTVHNCDPGVVEEPAYAIKNRNPYAQCPVNHGTKMWHAYGCPEERIKEPQDARH
jgi:hypothetical protein